MQSKPHVLRNSVASTDNMVKKYGWEQWRVPMNVQTECTVLCFSQCWGLYLWLVHDQHILHNGLLRMFSSDTCGSQHIWKTTVLPETNSNNSLDFLSSDLM